MADNIARIDGTDQAWYADKPAWHGKGLVTLGARTARQVVKAIPIFRKRVTKSVVAARIGGKWVEIPDRFATHREGSTDVLGIVSDEYELIQDTDGLLVMESVVNAARRASFVTAGLLGRGERAFASIDLSRVIDLRIKRDPSRQESHLFGTWAHDGSGALQIGLWHNRVECQNMLNMARSSAEAKGLLVAIRHTGDVADNLDEARRILGFAEKVAREHVELMNALAETPVKAKWLREFVEYVVPIPTDDELGKRAITAREDARDLILGLYQKAPDLVKVPQSAYRAHQAVVDYADHHRPLRIGADTPTEVAADRRFRSITEGPAADLKDRSLDFIRQTLLASAN
jgi:phage/plasmid-like protein (TIGR03299 family)